MRKLLAIAASIGCCLLMGLGTLPQLGSPVAYSSGGITFIQDVSGGARCVAATTCSITITPSGVNSLLVFMFSTNTGGGTFSSAVDSNGTAQIAQAYVVHGPGQAIYYVTSAASGGHTFTVTFTSSANIVLYAAEFSSAATGLDTASAMATGSSTSPLSASITPAAGNELLIGLISVNGAGTLTGWGSPLVQQQGPSSSPATSWAWVVEGSTPTAAASSATISPTDNWAASIVAFD